MLKNEDIEVLVFRRPNMFKVNENLYNMMGLNELQNLFTIEDYVCEPQALELYYPERFLNIVEQRVLVERIIKAKNYKEVRIITQSPFIIQCTKNVKIANVEDEELNEGQFKLSWDEVGLPDDGGLGVL